MKQKKGDFTSKDLENISRDLYNFYLKLAETIKNVGILQTINIYSFATGTGIFEALFATFLRLTYRNIQKINMIYFENGNIYSTLDQYKIFNIIVDGYQIKSDNSFDPDIFISIDPQNLSSTNEEFKYYATKFQSLKTPIVIIVSDNWNIGGANILEKCKFNDNKHVRSDVRLNNSKIKYITYIDNNDFFKYLDLNGIHYINKNSYTIKL